MTSPGSLPDQPQKAVPSRPADPSVSRLILSLATTQLQRRTPHFSAHATRPLWLPVLIVACAGSLAGAALVAPHLAKSAAVILLAGPFLAMAIWRLVALRPITARDRSAAPAAGADLPSYSVLVPLRDEAETLPGLVRALDRLIYPRDRLEIMLLLEQSDPATVAAARALDLPPWFRVVVVPEGEPHTKPKAMAYALYLATGDIVTVYDAEDTPDPDQLLRAASALAADPGLGCVQARLTIENPEHGWLAQQFAIEYDVLFSGLLPVLVRWQAPVPLGRTSNHFPRAVLQAAGGWDPYNVTEDADIGVRLHRLGYRIAMLPSRTREEAVSSLVPWVKQRTRWIKGWMQTYAVHMAAPGRLLRETGWRGFFMLQFVLGGPLLSAFVHPLFYVMLGGELLSGEFMVAPESVWGSLLMLVTVFNLVTGYLLAILLAVAISLRAGRSAPIWVLLTIPFYWLLISLAAYRAAYQLLRRPHHWEKTPHAPRPH